jgi:hypothetical protein
MTQTAAVADRDFLEVLFGPATQGQTYLNLLYLLLTFPLGMAYFIFFTTGFSLGVGLLVIIIGFPILILMLAACQVLGIFERSLVRTMLRVEIPSAPQRPPVAGLWLKFKALLDDSFTWRSFAYLMLEFPFGIASFCVLTTTLSLSVALILMPFTYNVVPADFGFWRVDSKNEAAVWCFVGIILLVGSLHLINGIALLWGRFARVMLSPSAAPAYYAPPPASVPAYPQPK